MAQKQVCLHCIFVQISQSVWLQVSDHVPLCCAATTTGTKQWICPAAQPCACPTSQTGLNPFSCYDPTAYSCSDTSPNWPKSGLITGAGMSDQGACPSTCKLSALLASDPHTVSWLRHLCDAARLLAVQTARLGLHSQLLHGYQPSFTPGASMPGVTRQQISI